MKKNEIKNLLNTSLDEKTPKLTKKILASPINTGDNALPAETKKTSSIKNRKSIFTWVSVAASVLVVVIVASVCGVYFTSNANQPVVTLETTCYEVDINPSVLITADKDGKVIHIASQNEDADIVLASEAFADYTDMTAEECMQTFIYESARLGYIDCTSRDNKIEITVVSGEKSSKLNHLAKQTAAKMQEYLISIDVFGIVSATTSAVKDFVADKGWQYSDGKLDSYIDNIESEYIYYRADNLGGNAFESINSEINAFIERLQNINTLLDGLDEVNEKIEEACGKSYWDCKYSLFAEFTDEVEILMAQADGISAQLESYGIKIVGVLSLDAYLIKYDIIEDLQNLYEQIKDGIAESAIVNTILDYIVLIDNSLYTKIKEQLTDFYEQVVSVIEEIRSERERIYSAIFDSRPAITQEEYDEYLK